jgi:hypothetical protein
VVKLESRRLALQQGDKEAWLRLQGSDAGVLPTVPTEAELWAMGERRFEIQAWYLRFERNEVRVTEEYHLVGTLPDRPVDEVGVSSLRLFPSENGEYSFQGGIL